MMNFEKIPKYRIIENDLVDKINAGEYGENAPLPTEAELSKFYSVSRVTVRQALSELSYKGFIYKNQGSGSFVKKSCSIQKTPLIKSFTEDILEQGRIPHSVVRSFNITDAGTTMAQKLGVKSSDKIYYIERTRFADDVPVLFERTFMSVELHPEVSMKMLQGSKYHYAEQQGFKIDHAYQNITPIFPTEYIANELKIAVMKPILRINNTTYLIDGSVFDYTELYMNTEEYQLNIIKRREVLQVTQT